MSRAAITLFENMRAIGYVPFYLAIQRGDWAREGVEVQIETAPDMTQTAAALLDGRADVSWGGPMRVLMHHDRDRDCPLVCFAQVVARDPFILVGRKPNCRFRFRDLGGKRIAVATEAPTPWMTFQDDLARAGVDPTTLNRAALLESCELDVVQLFEPYADDLVEKGAGHIWHRFAARGDIAYTSFYTTRRFASDQRDACRALVRGIASAQQALHRETPAAIAETITGFFPECSTAQLARIIGAYRKSGLWARTPALPAEAFVRLKEALLSGGLIGYDAPYDDLVDAELSAAPSKETGS